MFVYTIPEYISTTCLNYITRQTVPNCDASVGETNFSTIICTVALFYLVSISSSFQKLQLYLYHICLIILLTTVISPLIFLNFSVGSLSFLSMSLHDNSCIEDHCCHLHFPHSLDILFSTWTLY